MSEMYKFTGSIKDKKGIENNIDIFTIATSLESARFSISSFSTNSVLVKIMPLGIGWK